MYIGQVTLWGLTGSGSCDAPSGKLCVFRTIVDVFFMHEKQNLYVLNDILAQ